MEKDLSNSYLGRGLAFPLQVNMRGELTLVSGDQDIEQSIRIILGTRPGERVMRPNFGCKVQDMVFEPRNDSTNSQIKRYVMEALSFWEPRIRVRSVVTYTEAGADGAVFVDIDYEIKETHDQRSIVYPFFLAGEEEY